MGEGQCTDEHRLRVFAIESELYYKAGVRCEDGVPNSVEIA